MTSSYYLAKAEDARRDAAKLRREAATCRDMAAHNKERMLDQGALLARAEELEAQARIDDAFVAHVEQWAKEAA